MPIRGSSMATTGAGSGGWCGSARYRRLGQPAAVANDVANSDSHNTTRCDTRGAAERQSWKLARPSVLARRGSILWAEPELRGGAEVLREAQSGVSGDRTLDALHLEAAIRLDASGVLPYDRRLGEASRSAGLDVVSSGAELEPTNRS